MVKWLTGSDIAAEVLMVRVAFRGTILLVEGGRDCRLFRRFVDDSACVVLPAHGKERAMEAVRELEERGCAGILAIVDADFWHLEGTAPPSGNVVATDCHDMDVLIVASKSFDHFVAEYCSPKKVKRLKGAEDHFREALLSRALPIGILRYFSSREGWNLRFHGLKYRGFVDRQSLEVDLTELIQRVLANSSSREHTAEFVITQVHESLQSESHDALQYCCGEDIVELLALGLRHAIGSKDAKVASPENVGTVLRLAYDSNDFQQTRLFETASRWETENAPFRLFSKSAAV